jgi:hypothetical protein
MNKKLIINKLNQYEYLFDETTIREFIEKVNIYNN